MKFEEMGKWMDEVVGEVERKAETLFLPISFRVREISEGVRKHLKTAHRQGFEAGVKATSEHISNLGYEGVAISASKVSYPEEK